MPRKYIRKTEGEYRDGTQLKVFDAYLKGDMTELESIIIYGCSNFPMVLKRGINRWISKPPFARPLFGKRVISFDQALSRLESRGVKLELAPHLPNTQKPVTLWCFDRERQTKYEAAISVISKQRDDAKKLEDLAQACKDDPETAAMAPLLLEEVRNIRELILPQLEAELQVLLLNS
jgi:hypothetical protein